MHTNCFYNFKMALYFSAIVMKGFYSKVVLSQNCYCEAEGWPAFKCIAMHLPTHFYKEVLCLSGSPFVASTTSPLFSLASIHDVLC